MLRYFVVLAFLILSVLPVEAKRVALVMGNSDYTTFTSLPNPVNDARLMEKALREVGFEVTLVLNADQAQMKKAMLDFGRTLRRGVDASIFYYAGHGVQVKGENFLIPVEADLQDEDEVAVQAIDVNDFLQTMQSAKSPFNILILDACRNNPLNATRGGGGGLAPLNAPRGSYIAYATAPGAVALDGDGVNSPYTQALAGVLSMPGLKLEDVFKKTREQVLATSEDKQVPWETSSITGDFFFNDPKSVDAPKIAQIESYIVSEYLVVPSDDRSAKIASRYSSQITYYGKKWSRERVIQDKLKWYSRWSSGQLKLIQGTMKISDTFDENYEATFDAEYKWVGKKSGPDEGKELSGKVRVNLGLMFVDGSFKVFSENSEVIN